MLSVIIKTAYAESGERPWVLWFGEEPLAWIRGHIGTPHAKAILGSQIFALLVHKHICLERNNEPLREPPLGFNDLP